MIRPYILLAPGEGQEVSDEFLKRVSRHKTAKDAGHPELNLDIKEKKDEKDGGSGNPFQWLHDWIYPPEKGGRNSGDGEPADGGDAAERLEEDGG